MNTVTTSNTLWRRAAWTFPTLAVIILAMPLSAKADSRIDAGDLVLGATLAYLLHDAYSGHDDRYHYGDRYHRNQVSVAYWPRRHYHSARDYRRQRYCDDHRHRDYRSYYYAGRDYKRHYKRDRRDRQHDRRNHRRDDRRRNHRH